MKIAVVNMVMGLILCAAAEWAMAAPIASDSFDYPEGNLAENNGGSGWENAWYDVHPGGTPKTFVLPPSLEYTDSKGMKLSAAGSQVGIAYDTSRIINLDTAARSDLAPFVKDGKLGADGTTIWISLLAFCDEGGEAWSLVELREGEETEKLKIGHAGGATKWSYIDARTRQGKTPLTEQAFVVIRIDFKSGKDDIYMWTNPDLGTEPAFETADVKSRHCDASFNTIVFRGDVNDEVYVDELRIGTTWADVCKQELTVKIIE